MYAVPSKQHYAKEREGSSAQTLRAQGLVHFQGFCSRTVLPSIILQAFRLTVWPEDFIVLEILMWLCMCVCAFVLSVFLAVVVNLKRISCTVE